MPMFGPMYMTQSFDKGAYTVQDTVQDTCTVSVRLSMETVLCYSLAYWAQIYPQFLSSNEVMVLMDQVTV